MEKVFLAVDMGASSGRVVAGRLNAGQLTLEELHRFDNGPVHVGPHMHWDVLAQWTDIQDGLRIADHRFGDQVASLGVDTWGVDFGLLDRNDQILGNPYHYRDSRLDGILDTVFDTASRDEIFAETGLQFMQINTLYQLVSLQRAQSPQLEMAKTFLMVPDLFHWLLTGEKANEITDATTTQFLNPRLRQWSTQLLDRFHIPTDMLQTIIEPGTVLGKLRPEVARDVGLTNVNVVVPGTHDTASAVMSVPTASPPSDQPDWCYISSGTWSLMGVEVPNPVINDRCSELNFTNEGGVGGTIRLLKNICGLWLVQECRRVWGRAGKQFDWSQLVAMAESEPALRSHIAPDEARFNAPIDMPGTIAEYCRATNQPTPENEGQTIRCALESLALRYRQCLGYLEQLTGGRIDRIHIVGGGTQNRLLCQMTADACGRLVVAGPSEATAIGNVMMQAVAAGEVASIAEAREMVRSSFPVEQFEPKNTQPWDEAFRRFETLPT